MVKNSKTAQKTVGDDENAVNYMFDTTFINSVEILMDIADDSSGTLYEENQANEALGAWEKARGTITAECEAEVPSEPGTHDLEVIGILRDSTGDEVARARAVWRLDIHA